MKDKIIAYLVAIPIAVLLLCPPLPFGIPIFVNTLLWHWLVLASGLLMIIFLWSKANIIIKAISAYFFINCFLSSAPYISFTAYLYFIVCTYFYLLCLELKDWKPVFDVLRAILILNIFLLVMEFIGHDKLLNFCKRPEPLYGIPGNHMQTKGIILLLLVFIVQDFRRIKLERKKRFLILWSLCAAVIVYLGFDHTWSKFLTSRGPEWIGALKLCLKHPIVGWGIATFKALFQTLATGHYNSEGIWYAPHNFMIHILFEAGALGAGLVSALVVYMAVKARKISMRLFVGICVLFLVLCWTFMDRNLSTTLILAAFVAYGDLKIRRVIL
jgi:hypothetical protein